MKKYLFTLIIALCGIFNARAQQDLVDCVVVELNNGETLSLALRHTSSQTARRLLPRNIAENASD